MMKNDLRPGTAGKMPFLPFLQYRVLYDHPPGKRYSKVCTAPLAGEIQ